MKNLKKTLMTLSLAFVMVLSTLLLVACGETPPKDTRNFVVANQVKINTENVINYLVTNVYNNSTDLGTKTTYTVEEIKGKGGKFANFKYYVEVGTLENFGNVTSISFNGTEYTNTQNIFKLSVGNSNFIADNAFYVSNDNKLYVAAPVVAFETTLNSKIKINDKEFDFNLSPATANLNITGAEFSSGATSAVTRVDTTNEFNVTIKEANKWLGFKYANSVETDVFVTKKVLNGKLNGYGLTTANDKLSDGTSVLAYYPVPYSDTYNEAKVTELLASHNGKSLDYYVYCVGKGSAKIKINYTIYNPFATTQK